jgi:hypothetical protein
MRTPTAGQPFFANVRVHEQGAIVSQHAVGFLEHFDQRRARQVLEHVERPCFGERAVMDRKTPQVAEQQVAGGHGFPREVWRDIDARQFGTARRVPRERASAAASKIEHTVRRPGAKESPQHVVPDFRTQQRRRHRFVTGIGVQRLVEVFRLLGVGLLRPQVQVAGVRGEHPAAAGTRGRSSLPATRPKAKQKTRSRDTARAGRVRERSRRQRGLQRRFEAFGARIPAVSRGERRCVSGEARGRLRILAELHKRRCQGALVAGGTRSASPGVSALRESPQGPRPRSAGPL